MHVYFLTIALDFKKLHEAHFNKMESIDLYVQRRNKQLELLRNSNKELKVMFYFWQKHFSNATYNSYRVKGFAQGPTAAVVELNQLLVTIVTTWHWLAGLFAVLCCSV